MKRGIVLMLLGVLLLLGAAGLAAYNVYESRAAVEFSDAAVAELRDLIAANAKTNVGAGAEDSGSDAATAETPEESDEAAVASDSSGDDAPPQTSAAETAADTALPLWRQYPERQMPTVNLNGYRYVGILEVPAQNISCPVMEEWDYTRLKYAPCRYAGSVYTDSMVICGHNYLGQFSRLLRMGIGETVIFTDAEGNVFTYEVTNIETLKPVQVDEMLEGDCDLTLFTCNTGARTRRAIRCERISPEF